LLMVSVDPGADIRQEVMDELGVVWIQGSSQDEEVHERVCEVLDGRTIDLLYIDGDHLYEPVRHDWNWYSPLVSPEGVIVLDDAVITDNPTVEVHRLYEEVRVGRRSKLIYDGRGGTGMALIRS
jgi:cephalosporin hydroxylase